MNKWHLFYSECYCDMYKEFDTKERLEEFLSTLNFSEKSDTYIRSIIHGQEFKHVPYEKVTAYKVEPVKS